MLLPLHFHHMNIKRKRRFPINDHQRHGRGVLTVDFLLRLQIYMVVIFCNLVPNELYTVVFHSLTFAEGFWAVGGWKGKDWRGWTGTGQALGLHLI